jgi:hypothetical protein
VKQLRMLVLLGLWAEGGLARQGPKKDFLRIEFRDEDAGLAKVWKLQMTEDLVAKLKNEVQTLRCAFLNENARHHFIVRLSYRPVGTGVNKEPHFDLTLMTGNQDLRSSTYSSTMAQSHDSLAVASSSSVEQSRSILRVWATPFEEVAKSPEFPFKGEPPSTGNVETCWFQSNSLGLENSSAFWSFRLPAAEN